LAFFVVEMYGVPVISSVREKFCYIYVLLGDTVNRLQIYCSTDETEQEHIHTNISYILEHVLRINTATTPKLHSAGAAGRYFLIATASLLL
jgi:hypothetical protein